MMKFNLQLFGGRGGGSGMAGGGSPAGEAGYANLTAKEFASAQKQISTKAFEKVGNGNWELSTDGKVGIGAQILDETGSNKDPMRGFGGKVYGVTTWGKGVGDYRTTIISGSLNDAKAAAREEMKGWLNGRKK